MAYSAEVDGIFYNFKGDKAEVTYEFESHGDYEGDIIIPESVSYNGKTYNVTSIGVGAFSMSNRLTSVTIPNSVTSIGHSAFSHCYSLKSIIIPNSVTSIEGSVFMYCNSLANVTIGNSVKSIGELAFSDCGLTSVNIPNSVTKIGDRAFINCYSLSDVTMSENIEYIAGNAFYNTKWFNLQPDGPIYFGSILYKWKGYMGDNNVIEIKDGTKNINENAFYKCEGNSSVIIPNSVTSIGHGAFYDCSGLTSITIPNSVTSIGDYAFEGCTNLSSVALHCKEISSWFSGLTIKNIELGDEVEIIGEYAFAGFSGLTSITIPNSLTTIGYSAFKGCSGLTSISIPNSVTSIGTNVFQGCTNLSSVAVYCKEIGNCFSGLTSIKNIELGDEVETIGANAFKGCTGLTFFTIPNSVTTIGNYAFQNCSGLTSITIQSSITNIGTNVFQGCTNLSSVAFHCKEIGSWFSGMTSIKNIELGDEVETIGTNAFIGCKGLASITIPSSVTTIGDYAFQNCSGLTSISIPSSVTYVGCNAFRYCSSLTMVSISDLARWCGIKFGSYFANPLYYANHLYLNGEEITVLTIPNSVNTIESYAFCGGRALKSVTFPSSVTRVAEEAFDECTGLTAVNISDLACWCGIVFSYQANPLCYAHHLYLNGEEVKELVVPDGVTAIGSYAFEGCKELTKVTLAKSLTSIGYSAFSGCQNITEVNSPIEEPFEIDGSCFDYNVYNNATLNVPSGMRSKYRETYSWSEFTTIWDGTLEPVEGNDDVNYGGGDVNSSTDLDGNVIGNIYYSIADDNGEYSSAEGCIVVRKPTGDDVVSGIGDDDLFSDELKDAFTGIIFMVQPGSGVITMNAETTGGMTLKVKVGDNPPTEIELKDKIKARFPYSVDKASYVYIYAGGGSAGAKAMGKAASNNGELKIYSIEWSNSTDGIKEMKDERLKMNDSDVYNLNGQKVDGMPTKKGVYIKDGKKVLVK